MKKLFTFILFVFALVRASAQDEAVFTHYYINPILINPAYAGFDETHRLQMNLRNQWTGFPGAPATYMVGYNGPIGKTLGVGAGVLSENIAQLTRFRVNLNYAFRYHVNDFKFSAGFSTEFQQMRLANSVLDQSDPLYDQGDFLVEEAVDGISIFDAALGFYGSVSDATYFGLSFPNLIRARLDEIETGTDTRSSFFQFYIFNLGHRFIFEEYGFKLEPSLMMRKIRNVPFQVDFNLLSSFMDDKVQAGLTYRLGTGGAFGLLLGTRISALSAYYSYDVAFSNFQQYNNGSHEVTVAFDIGRRKDKKAQQKK